MKNSRSLLALLPVLSFTLAQGSYTSNYTETHAFSALFSSDNADRSVSYTSTLSSHDSLIATGVSDQVSSFSVSSAAPESSPTSTASEYFTSIALSNNSTASTSTFHSSTSYGSSTPRSSSNAFPKGITSELTSVSSIPNDYSRSSRYSNIPASGSSNDPGTSSYYPRVLSSGGSISIDARVTSGSTFTSPTIMASNSVEFSMSSNDSKKNGPSAIATSNADSTIESTATSDAESWRTITLSTEVCSQDSCTRSFSTSIALASANESQVSSASLTNSISGAGASQASSQNSANRIHSGSSTTEIHENLTKLTSEHTQSSSSNTPPSAAEIMIKSGTSQTTNNSSSVSTRSTQWSTSGISSNAIGSINSNSNIPSTELNSSNLVFSTTWSSAWSNVATTNTPSISNISTDSSYSANSSIHTTFIDSATAVSTDVSGTPLLSSQQSTAATIANGSASPSSTSEPNPTSGMSTTESSGSVLALTETPSIHSNTNRTSFVSTESWQTITLSTEVCSNDVCTRSFLTKTSKPTSSLASNQSSQLSKTSQALDGSSFTSEITPFTSTSTSSTSIGNSSATSSSDRDSTTTPQQTAYAISKSVRSQSSRASVTEESSAAQSSDNAPIKHVISSISTVMTIVNGTSTLYTTWCPLTEVPVNSSQFSATSAVSSFGTSASLSNTNQSSNHFSSVQSTASPRSHGSRLSSSTTSEFFSSVSTTSSHFTTESHMSISSSDLSRTPDLLSAVSTVTTATNGTSTTYVTWCPLTKNSSSIFTTSSFLPNTEFSQGVSSLVVPSSSAISSLSTSLNASSSSASEESRHAVINVESTISGTTIATLESWKTITLSTEVCSHRSCTSSPITTTIKMESATLSSFSNSTPAAHSKTSTESIITTSVSSQSAAYKTSSTGKIQSTYAPSSRNIPSVSTQLSTDTDTPDTKNGIQSASITSEVTSRLSSSLSTAFTTINGTFTAYTTWCPLTSSTQSIVSSSVPSSSIKSINRAGSSQTAATPESLTLVASTGYSDFSEHLYGPKQTPSESLSLSVRSSDTGDSSTTLSNTNSFVTSTAPSEVFPQISSIISTVVTTINGTSTVYTTWCPLTSATEGSVDSTSTSFASSSSSSSSAVDTSEIVSRTSTAPTTQIDIVTKILSIWRTTTLSTEVCSNNDCTPYLVTTSKPYTSTKISTAYLTASTDDSETIRALNSPIRTSEFSSSKTSSFASHSGTNVPSSSKAPRTGASETFGISSQAEQSSSLSSIVTPSSSTLFQTSDTISTIITTISGIVTSYTTWCPWSSHDTITRSAPITTSTPTSTGPSQTVPTISSKPSGTDSSVVSSVNSEMSFTSEISNASPVGGTAYSFIQSTTAKSNSATGENYSHKKPLQTATVPASSRDTFMSVSSTWKTVTISTEVCSEDACHSSTVVTTTPHAITLQSPVLATNSWGNSSTVLSQNSNFTSASATAQHLNSLAATTESAGVSVIRSYVNGTSTYYTTWCPLSSLNETSTKLFPTTNTYSLTSTITSAICQSCDTGNLSSSRRVSNSEENETGLSASFPVSSTGTKTSSKSIAASSISAPAALKVPVSSGMTTAKSDIISTLRSLDTTIISVESCSEEKCTKTSSSTRSTVPTMSSVSKYSYSNEHVSANRAAGPSLTSTSKKQTTTSSIAAQDSSPTTYLQAYSGGVVKIAQSNHLAMFVALMFLM